MVIGTRSFPTRGVVLQHTPIVLDEPVKDGSGLCFSIPDGVGFAPPQRKPAAAKVVAL
jgi:hypothetical protein